MAYRGADLDLRTARTFSAASTDITGGFDDPPSRPDSGEGALWVDDTLLACANQAYDIAAAHRAREVRLDHLVHAFTRSEAAAAELEARGVRVPALRRNSAIAVASEIASAPPEDSEQPHPSSELEEVLRLAAGEAANASRPASVGDVLHVLIDLRSDAPGSALLLRHSPRATGREFWSTLVSTRPPRAASAARNADGGERERAPSAAAPGQLTKPAAEQRRPAEFTLLQGMLDRMSEIERAMSDRLEAVESALGNIVPARLDMDAVAQRIDHNEQSARVPNGGSELNDRLAALEQQLADERAERVEALSSLSADVKALVSALGGAAPGTNQPSIVERLQILAEDIDQHRDAAGAHFGDRLAAIEQGLEQQAEKLAAELAEVNESVTKLNVNQQLLAGSMDQWRSNDAGEIHLINSRLGAVQEDGTKRLKMLERLSADIEALSQLTLEDQEPGETKSDGGLRDQLRFRQWLLGTEDWIKASWQKRPRSSWLKRSGS
jgi:hypothetical protein